MDIKLEAEDDSDDTTANTSIDSKLENGIKHIKIEKMDDADMKLDIKEETLEIEIHLDPKCTRKIQWPVGDETKTGNNRKFRECEICHKIFWSKKILTLHYRTHKREKPFECPICNYRGCRKFALRRHFHIHTGKRPFKCKVCGFKCFQEGSLMDHFQTHPAARKWFTCTHCDYKCLRNNGLRTHLRTFHREQPFACNICGYYSFLKQDWRNHARTHITKKPLECTACYFQTYEKKCLKEHFRIHTLEKAEKQKFLDDLDVIPSRRRKRGANGMYRYYAERNSK